MASIFTRIVRGELPCYKVAENEEFLAFLDINPVSKGHTLVIPKEEVDYIFAMDEAAMLRLHAFAAKIAKALDKVVPSQRVAMTVVGLEVPHVHIHLVPLAEGLAFVDFARQRVKLAPEALSALAQAIGAAL